MLYITLFYLCLLTFIQASPPGSDKYLDYREDIFAKHNAYRAEQCASPLQRNASLNNIAQDHCNKIATTGDFAHSNRTDVGETSFQKIPWDRNKDNGTTPVTYWYSERVNYTVANPGQALHFTQLVWKATKTIGIGICDISSNGLVVVVNYYPRGNYENQFAQNVGCSN